MFVSLVVNHPPTPSYISRGQILNGRAFVGSYGNTPWGGASAALPGQTAIPLVGLLRRPVQPGPGSRRLLVALRLVLLVRRGLCLTPGRRV
jgi:hypothetical protein